MAFFLMRCSAGPWRLSDRRMRDKPRDNHDLKLTIALQNAATVYIF